MSVKNTFVLFVLINKFAFFNLFLANEKIVSSAISKRFVDHEYDCAAFELEVCDLAGDWCGWQTNANLSWKISEKSPSKSVLNGVHVTQVINALTDRSCHLTLCDDYYRMGYCVQFPPGVGDNFNNFKDILQLESGDPQAHCGCGDSKINGSIPYSKEDFDRNYFGVVYSPYDDYWEQAGPSETLTNPPYFGNYSKIMAKDLKKISEKFIHVAVFGNFSQWNQINRVGEVPQLSARINANLNYLTLRVAVGITRKVYSDSDLEWRPEDYFDAIYAARNANEIFNGTVWGIIIASETNTMSQTSSASKDLEIMTWVKSEIHQNKLYLKVGVRLTACEDYIDMGKTTNFPFSTSMDYALNPAASKFTEFQKILRQIANASDFLLCRMDPFPEISSLTHLMSMEASIDYLQEKIISLRNALSQINPRLRLIIETGVPSEGFGGWYNNSLETFWYHWESMAKLAKKEHIMFQMFEAIDHPDMLDGPYGWWTRQTNSESFVYIEKVGEIQPSSTTTTTAAAETTAATTTTIAAETTAGTSTAATTTAATTTAATSTETTTTAETTAATTTAATITTITAETTAGTTTAATTTAATTTAATTTAATTTAATTSAAATTTTKATKQLSLNESGDLLKIVIISFSVLGLIGVSVMIHLWRKLHTAKRHVVSQAYVNQFHSGCDDGSVDENYAVALRIPYNRKYELQRENFNIEKSIILGRGQYGVVHAGTIKGDEGAVQVAFKCTTSESSVVGIKSIMSEIKILSYLGKHENLLCILGAFTKKIQRGIVYLALELCPLGSAEEFLRKAIFVEFDTWNEIADDIHIPQPCVTNSTKYVTIVDNGNIDFGNSKSPESKKFIGFSTMLMWSEQIANALDYVSQMNVVHADLSTKNVLLVSINHVKVSDFGLSKKMYESLGVTHNKDTPLPWRWMAPESLKHLAFSSQSDVWSYGVALWEIFSLGEVPYHGASYDMEFLTKLINGHRLPIAKHASPDIYKEMKKCWELEPSSRPSFKQLREFFKDLVHEHTSI